MNLGCECQGNPVVFHAWSEAAAIMAGYDAAFAAGGKRVEFPMFDFSLGAEMMDEQGRIKNGDLLHSRAPGLGLTLIPEMDGYPFYETAVYSCALIDFGPLPNRYWAVA